jgi:hypothetical protein
MDSNSSFDNEEEDVSAKLDRINASKVALQAAGDDSDSTVSSTALESRWKKAKQMHSDDPCSQADFTQDLSQPQDEYTPRQEEPALLSIIGYQPPSASARPYYSNTLAEEQAQQMAYVQQQMYAAAQRPMFAMPDY